MPAITFLMEGVEVFVLEKSKPSPQQEVAGRRGGLIPTRQPERGRGPLRPSALWLLSEQERDLGQTGHELVGVLIRTGADAVVVTKGSDAIGGNQSRAEEERKPTTSSSCVKMVHLRKKEAKWLLKEKSGK